MNLGERISRDQSSRFLKATAAAGLGTAAAAAGIAPAGVPRRRRRAPPTPPHGAQLRGMDLVIKARRPRVASGSCSRASRHPASDACSTAWVRPWKSSQPPTPAVLKPQKTKTTPSTRTPARFLTSGFTFFGQFVDHDITFDTTLLSDQQSDPYATTNFRTPRYDLDAIYGRGPALDPEFYDPNDRTSSRSSVDLTARSTARSRWRTSCASEDLGREARHGL